MTDNKLSGAELKNLLKYDNLETLKFGANNIKTLTEIEILVNLT
jgi:hypothetical protein